MNRWQRSVLIGLIICWAVFFVAQPAQANGLFYGEKLASDQVVNRNIVLYGPSVNVDGAVNGDVFAIGNVVTVNGDIQGNLFVAGQSIIMNGSVGGSIYATSVEMELGPSASISQNLTYAGVSLNGQQGSQIGRDLYAATLGAQLSGEVGRNTQAIIGLLEFVRLFTQNVDLQQLLSPQAPAGGSNTFAPENPYAGVVLASFFPITNQSNQTANWGEPSTAPKDWLPSYTMQTGSGIDTARLGEWALERLRLLTIYLVIGLALVWRLPTLMEHWTAAVKAKPLSAAGFGLLAAINGYVIAIVLATLLLLVGFWLGSINLWELTSVLWSIGYSTVGLGFAIFMLFFSYGSKIIIAHLVGRSILNRLSEKAASNNAFSLLLGLIIYVLLRSIPVLGWVLAALVTALGLGAIWWVYRQRWLVDAPQAPIT
jgi:cytoskeletal protein CcmA (bactofilin family)